MAARSKQQVGFIYGIYAGDDLCYVGSTRTSIRKRFKAHIKDLEKFTHCNGRLLKLARERGTETFGVRWIETVPLEGLLSREYEIIRRYKGLGHDLTNIMTSEKADSRLKTARRANIPIRIMEQAVNTLVDRRLYVNDRIRATMADFRGHVEQFCEQFPHELPASTRRRVEVALAMSEALEIYG